MKQLFHIVSFTQPVTVNQVDESGHMSTKKIIESNTNWLKLFGTEIIYTFNK